MIKTKAALMVAALCVSAAMGAVAGEPWSNEIRIEHETVRFDDLNLGKAAGVAALHWRLRLAATDVCVKDGLGRDIAQNQRQKLCRKQALERALASVPAPVSAYHAAWTAKGADWFAKPQATSATQLAAAQ